MRTRLERLLNDLELERQSFDATYKDVSHNMMPTRARFHTTNVNRGDRRSNHIIDNTSLIALRTFRSGFMSGLTSPDRIWWRFTTPDAALAQVPRVKEWLHRLSRRMSVVFDKSNIYTSFNMIYGDLALFAIAAMSIEEDPDTVIKTKVYPIGSYYISTNEKGDVTVWARKYRMTVRQVVEEFGTNPDGTLDFTNITFATQQLWETNSREAWVDVVHIIEPNDKSQPDTLESSNKKFRSIWFERGRGSKSKESEQDSSSVERDKFLRFKGFDMFPIAVPRWDVTGEDIYGTSGPGLDSLGDVKALQRKQRRALQVLEKIVRPSLIAPANMRNKVISLMPGDVTTGDFRDGDGGVRPIHDVDYKMSEIERSMDEDRQRIKIAFFEPLFLAFLGSDRREQTATEVDRKQEEKLLNIGPALGRVNQELLKPVIDLTFEMMKRQNKLPQPIPPELSGVDLKVEFVSVLAAAARAASAGGLERFLSVVAQLAAVKPEAFDKINVDETVDEFAEIMTVPPRIVVSDEDVAELRAQRAQVQAEQLAAQAREQAASTAKDASKASLAGDTVLSRVAEGVQ